MSTFPSEDESLIASYLESGERILLACNAWVGLRRRVLGVTDHRMIMVKSHYYRRSDRGLLWGDPVDDVALSNHVKFGDYHKTHNGNVYVQIRRPNGQIVTVNPRKPGLAYHTKHSARDNTARLYALVPGRFSGYDITMSWQMLSPKERSSLQDARDLMFAFPGWACWWDPVAYQWCASPPKWGAKVSADRIGELRQRIREKIAERDVYQ